MDFDAHPGLTESGSLWTNLVEDAQTYQCLVETEPLAAGTATFAKRAVFTAITEPPAPETAARGISRGIGPGTPAAPVIFAPRMLQPPASMFHLQAPTLEVATRGITRGTVVVTVVTVQTSVLIHPADLAPVESLASWVRAGLAPRPPPQAWLRAAALEDPIAIPGRISVGLRVFPPPVVPPMLRSVVTDVEPLLGKITTGLFIPQPKTVVHFGGTLVEPEQLTGKVSVGFQVAAQVTAATPAIVIRPAQLTDAEQLAGRITPPTPLAPRAGGTTQRPVQLYLEPDLPGRVAVGLVVRAPVLAPTTIRPTQLPPIEELPGHITTGYFVPAPVFPVLQHAVRVEEPETIPGRIRVGYLVTQPTPAIVIRPTVLYVEPDIPGRLVPPLFAPPVQPPFTTPTLPWHATFLFEPEVLPSHFRPAPPYPYIPPQPRRDRGGGRRHTVKREHLRPEKVIRIGYDDIAPDVALVNITEADERPPDPLPFPVDSDDEILLLLM